MSRTKRDRRGRYAGSTASAERPFGGIFDFMARRRRQDPVRAEATETIDKLKANEPSKYWSVSRPGSGYKMHRVGDDGYVGIKRSPESIDVGALVAQPGAKGVTKRAFGIADRSHPEHPQTLDAFDGHLPKIYGKHGFTETGRIPFDPQYAPQEWHEPTHGRPDLVSMARPAAQGSLFPADYPTRPTPEAPKAQERLHPVQFKGQLKLPGT